MQYSYRIPDGDQQPVDVGLYDMAGRRVRMLASGSQASGQYTVTWDGRSDAGSLLSPGVYFLRARVAGALNTSRVIFIRR